MLVSLRHILLLAIAFSLLAVGCSDDDDDIVGPTEEPHLEAIGALLVHDGDTLVTINGTTATGELEVHEGDTLGPIEVFFLHPDDLEWYDPTDVSQSHTLRLLDYDSDVTNALIGTDIPGVTDPWTFALIGDEEGETSARVSIYHIDHPDYTSPLVDIHVEHEGGHQNAVGCKLVVDGEDVVTVDGSSISGELHIHEGETESVTVWFLDPDGDWFQPHAEDGFSLDLEVGDTGVLTVTPDSEMPWVFDATGNEEGETTISVSIMHEGHSDYTSPAMPVHVEHEGGHQNAVGCKLVVDGEDVVTVDGSNISGELHIHEGETESVTVWFLDPDGDWFQPHAEDGFSLDLEVGDTGVLTVTPDGALPWVFDATGNEEGETTISVSIMHEDHSDYTSPAMPVHVEHEGGHASAVGCKLVLDGEDVVTVDGSNITGELHIHEGETESVTVWFLDPDGDWFQPHADDGFSLDLEVGNTDVLTVTPDGAMPWVFDATGNEEGETTISVSVVHNDHSDYTSPAMPVHVEHEGGHQNAVGCKLVVDGEDVVTVDGSNITGELHIHEGETESVTVWFLDPDGDWFQPHAEDGFSLDFEVGDTGVLTVTPDGALPWVFDAAGSEEGETTISVSIMHEGHSDYTSPAMPVHVEHEGGHASAVGCKLVLDGVDVVTADGTNITGSLELADGETTDLISVWFLDPDGDWFQPEDEDFSLGTILDGGNFSIDADAGDTWQFTATGTSVGAGTIQIQLMHHDHSDFTSPQLPVNTTSGS